MPSRVSVDGGTDASFICSAVRPSHFWKTVARCQSRNPASIGSSSITWSGSTRGSAMAAEGRRAKSTVRREARDMFDLDSFIDDCLTANRADQPRLAVKEVLDRAMSAPGEVADALPPTKAELVKLHASDELTILQVVWAPGMSIRPHDHRTWASIGIYSGGEDNTFFRRADGRITPSGGKELRPEGRLPPGRRHHPRVHNPTDRVRRRHPRLRRRLLRPRAQRVRPRDPRRAPLRRRRPASASSKRPTPASGSDRPGRVRETGVRHHSGSHRSCVLVGRRQGGEDEHPHHDDVRSIRRRSRRSGPRSPPRSTAPRTPAGRWCSTSATWPSSTRRG